MDQIGKYDVAITACDTYEDDAVESAMWESLEAIGGLSFVKPGMRIAVKVNLVTALKPDTAATVHPSVVCALVRILKELGADVVIGDGPGGMYNAGYLKVVYDVCGMRQAEKYGAELNNDFSVEDVEYTDAVKAKFFPYTAYLGKVDAIIDLCKLKTHGMMGMTCAVKNFFGTIPGSKKPEYHYIFPQPDDFADVLVDLYEYSAPRLCICDAVIGMEGNGPTMGTPRKIGCLIASSNGHMMDAVAAGLIGLSVEDIPTLRSAVRRKLLTKDTSSISVYGDPEQFKVPDFKTVSAKSDVFFHVMGNGPVGKVADFIAARIMTPYPKLDPDTCIGCGKCAQTCPAKAITMKNGKPRIDRSVCIHCFCCQEFCPKGAMKVGRTWIRRILKKES